MSGPSIARYLKPGPFEFEIHAVKKVLLCQAKDLPHADEHVQKWMLR